MFIFMAQTGRRLITGQPQKNCVKAQRSFKISEARMLDLSTNKVGVKTTYNGEYCFHSVLKRGKRWADVKPELLPKQTSVKAAKKER